jgi:lactococcin 972 family bacteriocin
LAVIAAAVMGVALWAGGASTASATTEYPPEGGVWQYGVIEPASTVFVYSQYYHGSKLHRSSVSPTSGGIYRSANAAAGQWSYVDRQTSYSGNRAWYAVY